MQTDRNLISSRPASAEVKSKQLLEIDKNDSFWDDYDSYMITNEPVKESYDSKAI